MNEPFPPAPPATPPGPNAKFDQKTALEAAYGAHREGKLAEAEAVYRQLVAADPANHDAWHLLGGVMLQTADFCRAEENFLKALALKEDPLFLLNLGRALQAQQKWEGAVKALRRAIELVPRNIEMRHQLGVVLRHWGKFEDAEAALRSTFELGERQPATLYALGTVLEKSGRLAQAESVLREAIERKPAYGEAWFQLGLVLNRSGRLAEAEEAHRQAIALGQTSAEALHGLGVVVQRRRKWDEAEALFQRAVELKPDLAAAINGVGTIHRQRGRFAQAEAAFRRAIELEPDHFWALNNLGVLLSGLGRHEESETILRRALELRPDNADVLLNLGMVLLATGRFEEGWPFYEARYTPGRFDGSLRSPACAFPVWSGEPLAGKSLVIWSEQGFGDTIQVVRYVALLRQLGLSKLTWVCREPLRELLSTVDGIDHVIDHETAPQPHDYWCHAMSLPLRLGTVLETIPANLPYLRASPQRVAKWRPQLPAGGFKVGLVWKGSADHLNDANRSLPGLQTLAPLWSVPGVTFVSLQKGAGEQEALKPPDGQPIWPLGSDIADFADVAAIVELLDLVISVDTATVHVAGALGKPTWALLPAHGVDFRWLVDRKDSPWYPGVMRLFHQHGTGDWKSALTELQAELVKLVPKSPVPRHSQLAMPSIVIRAPQRTPINAPALSHRVKALQALGAAARKEGRLADAEAALREALALDVNHADVHFALGNLLRASGRGQEAQASYRAAIALAPGTAMFHSNLGVLLRAEGRVQEAETSYRLAIQADPNYPEAHANLGNLLSATGRADMAEASYRAALAAKPGLLSALNGLGALLMELKRWDDAEVMFKRAVEVNPASAESWNNLGTMLQDVRRLKESEEAYARALVLQPDFADASNNLGILLQKAGRREEAQAIYQRAKTLRPSDPRFANNEAALLVETKHWDDAEIAYRRALELLPDYPDAHNNLGALLHITNRPHEAEKELREALRLKPDFAECQLNLGSLLLTEGRLEEGWPMYESRRSPELADPTVHAPKLPCPEWRGESLQGKTLIIWPEQGFGDCIQFVRYAPLLKALGAAQITVVCHPPLKAVLQTVSGVDQVIDDLAQLRAHDFWAFALSLPMHLGTTLESIPAQLPYMRPDAKLATQWQARLPPSKLKIGLVWKGAAGHRNDMNRSLPSLATLAPLWTIPGARFVSLQKGQGEDEATKPPPGQAITALGHGIRDFGDSAAIVASLDLVICVDTAIAHLAGAMGKPVSMLLPAVGSDWRWMRRRTDSPWYPGVMRLFRQPVPGDWATPIREIVESLDATASKEALPPAVSRRW